MKRYKVTATKEELDDIGISYDINGLTGDLIKVFDTGWLCLSITHKYDSCGFINEFTNEFDLPKYMCIEIND